MAQKQALHPHRKGSVVWATVLSWLSSLLLALLALCLVLMTTICSAAYMKEQVNRSDFSEAAYSYLYDNFISYGASSGFSADVMTAALSRDQITADMADSITRLYQGDTAIDTRNAILNTTYDNLINDLNGRGVEVTSDVNPPSSSSPTPAVWTTPTMSRYLWPASCTLLLKNAAALCRWPSPSWRCSAQSASL